MDSIFDTPWYSLEQAVYEPLGRSRDVGVCLQRRGLQPNEVNYELLTLCHDELQY
jgi:hypothetical protein